MSKSIYVIVGKEESLVGARCRELRDKLIEPAQRTMGLFDADAADVSLSDVLDELRTAPFLTDRRVVLIRGADNFISQNRRVLENYFDNPCPTGILVMTVSTWPAKTKLAKKLPAVGELVSVSAPKRPQLPSRLIQYADDAHGKNLTRAAAELLIELAGDELIRLYSEIDKLALFADAEKAITPGHIELLVGHNRLFNAFSVIDLSIAGDASGALQRARSMFAADRDAQYTVVGAFAFVLRRMFLAKVMLARGTRRDEVEKRLQIWSRKERFFSLIRQMPLDRLAGNLRRLAATDYAIKTGRTKPNIAIEQLVLELAAC